MDRTEMIKQTKNDFKNFNSLVGKLRVSKLKFERDKSKLDDYEMKLFERDIRRYELNIEKIKIALGILTEMELQIITDSYFEKITAKNIAIKLNVSSETVFVHKRRAIEKLAKIMYDHL